MASRFRRPTSRARGSPSIPISPISTSPRPRPRPPTPHRSEHGKPLPAANQPGQGLYFNPYFANLNIAMPPPLTSAGQVTYAPGNPPPTVDQMAKDVSAFLVWAAEPKLEARHRSGPGGGLVRVVGSAPGFSPLVRPRA